MAQPDANESPADGSGMAPGWLDEWRRATGKDAASKAEQDAAMNDLRSAIDALPPSKRKRARRLGKKANAALEADRQLREIVKRKQEQQASEKASAGKEAYRRTYRAEVAVA